MPNPINPHTHLQSSLQVSEMEQQRSLETAQEQGIIKQQQEIEQGRDQKRVKEQEDVEKKEIADEEGQNAFDKEESENAQEKENSEEEQESPAIKAANTRGKNFDIKI